MNQVMVRRSLRVSTDLALTGSSHLVVNILPGQLAAVNGLIYFSAGREELWVSDGTGSGTRVLEGVRFSGKMLPFDGKLFFSAVDTDHGEELWVTDGTSEGTRIVADLSPGPISSSPYELTVVNGVLLFFVRLANGSYGLFRMASSSSAPVLVMSFPPVFVVSPWIPTGPGELTVMGSIGLFVATIGGKHTELWKTDGTTEGTVLVKDITLGGSFIPLFMIAEQGRILFDSLTPPSGRQLWVSDGTPAGTIPLLASPGLAPLGTFDKLFFFWAFESLAQGVVLWKTDGTVAGTASMKAFSSYTGLSFASRSGLAFAAGDFDHGVELWRTDGTIDRTVLVRDISPGPESSSPLNMTVIDGILLFSAIDPVHGRELWRSDGTQAGTFLIEDINPGSSSSGPQGFTLVGDSIFFGADGGPNGAGLWTIPVSALGSEPRLRERTPHELLFRR